MVKKTITPTIRARNLPCKSCYYTYGSHLKLHLCPKYVNKQEGFTELRYPANKAEFWEGVDTLEFVKMSELKHEAQFKAKVEKIGQGRKEIRRQIAMLEDQLKKLEAADTELNDEVATLYHEEYEVKPIGGG